MGDSEGGQKVSYASPAMILEQQTSGKEYPTGRVWKSQLVQKRLSGVGRGADMKGLNVFLAFGRLMCRIKEFQS